MVDHGSLTRGYYAVARYQPDAVRGEFRNIAVLFVDEAGTFGGIRAVRPGSVSRTVAEYSVVAGVIAGVEERLRAQSSGVETLRELAREYSHSVVLTPPQPAVTADSPDKLLNSLYFALVAPRSPRAAGFTKGHVLDHLVKWARRIGAQLEVGGQFDGHTFDALLRPLKGPTNALHVASLAARNVSVEKVEEEAGNFLFAASRVSSLCVGVIQPAPATAPLGIRELETKISKWFEQSGVPISSPSTFRAAYERGQANGIRYAQLELGSSLRL